MQNIIYNRKNFLMMLLLPERSIDTVQQEESKHHLLVNGFELLVILVGGVSMSP